MKLINHQFINEPFFLADWEVKHLLIGTFNPEKISEGGVSVNYYYGRQKNQTWKLLSNIFCCDLNPNSEDFFFLLKKNKIACIDMITQLKVSENKIDNIIGKGFKDTEIINGTVERIYNTIAIQKLINENVGVKTYSTWGKGPNLKEWKQEIEKIGKLIALVSPSMAAKVPKGSVKFDYMLDDWKPKIKHVC